MKRILAALICLSFLLPCADVRAEPLPFAGGEGTADNPYLIENESQLSNVRLYLNACFLVTADILCTKAWNSIGTLSAPFTGCFDGDGHTVSGMQGSTSLPGTACQGLFGHNAGTVRNVNIAACRFSASAKTACAGAIAGVNSGIIEGCSASGQIEASTAAGGLTGKQEFYGILRRCSSSCTVTSSGAAGGIAGMNSGQITNCCNTGSVTGYTAGGITGQGALPGCCYNIGTVSGTTLGGIVGDAPASYVNENDGTTCFFLDNVPAGTSNNAACVMLTDALMRLSDSYYGFDFDNVWYMGSYPMLRMKAPSKPVTKERLEITSQPDKIVYLENELFCADGLTVTVCYSNGTRKPVTDYMIGGYEATAGEHIITVTWEDLCATFAVTVNAIVPDTITSAVYTVASGWLRKIPPCTTVADLTANLNESTHIAVYNGQTKAHRSAYVRTGMTVAVLEGDVVKTSLTAVVTGDISGDGKLTTADLTSSKAHLLKSDNLTGAAVQAADCNGDGNVTLTDFLLLNAHILGKRTVQPN